ADATWQRMQELGEPLGAREVGVDALDHCSLENWYFSIRTLQGAPKTPVLTPLELQLQWRVNYEKDFVGAEALPARREAGAHRRPTACTRPSGGGAGQRGRGGGGELGAVLSAAGGGARGAGRGAARLDHETIDPGMGQLAVEERNAEAVAASARGR